ncbi:MAG: hypothetical protein N2319_00125 [Candidatus Kapabacteria bacterium]|nr:hypothetical protein [Candidatus Kapabacteria bacterium]
MKKIVLLLITFLLVTQISLTQRDVYYDILASKGNPSIQKSNQSKWDKLKTGMLFQNNDRIKLSEGDYIVLAGSNGKTVELKNAGEFSKEDIDKLLQNKKKNMTSRFSGYIVEQIKGQKGILEKDDYRENMGVTGSVERGFAGSSTATTQITSKINVASPRRINILANSYRFIWTPQPNQKDYQIIVTDRYDEEIFKQKVTGNEFIFDVDKLKLNKDEFYFVKVTAQGNSNLKSDDYCLMFMSDVTFREINDSLEALKQELDDVNSAFANLMYANFFEQNYMFEQAEQYYKTAIQLEPEVEEYKNLYTAFLKRINKNQ